MGDRSDRPIYALFSNQNVIINPNFMNEQRFRRRLIGGADNRPNSFPQIFIATTLMKSRKTTLQLPRP